MLGPIFIFFGYRTLRILIPKTIDYFQKFLFSKLKSQHAGGGVMSNVHLLSLAQRNSELSLFMSLPHYSLDYVMLDVK